MIRSPTNESTPLDSALQRGHRLNTGHFSLGAILSAIGPGLSANVYVALGRADRMGLTQPQPDETSEPTATEP